MLSVVNIKSGEPYDVYIGRTNRTHGLFGGPWQNPYVIGKDGDRAAVLARYEETMRWWLRDPKVVAKLLKLDGKRVACWCAPEPCHGDVLSRLIDELKSQARPELLTVT